MPEGAVYVGRPSIWGNPYKAETFGRWSNLIEGNRFLGQSTDLTWATRAAVERFSLHIGPMGNYEYDDATLAKLHRDLAGKDLACWCPLDQPCHADVLLEIANDPTP